MTDAPMTEAELEAEHPVIAMSQRLHHKLNTKIVAKGGEPVDALIGGMYASAEFAAVIVGGPHAAIKWLRHCVDSMERTILAETEAGSRGADGYPIKGKPN